MIGAMIGRFWKQVSSIAMWEIPHKKYDRIGLYTQAVLVVAFWSFMTLHPVFTGHPIATGYAVAALGFAAVIMAARTEFLTTVEKIVWICICAAFFLWELKIIDKDNSDREHQHLVDMQKQQQEFDASMEKFSKTDAELDKTMQGLSKNLATAQATFEQTKPHAYVQFSRLVFGPEHILMSEPLGIDFYYENTGNEPATQIWKMGRGDLCDPDQSDADQRSLLVLFEADWNEHKKSTTPGKVMAPGGNPLFDSFRFRPLTADEIDRLKARKLALCSMFRFQYTDHTGTWISEHCDISMVQTNEDGSMHIVGSHCSFFNDSRRRLTPP